MYKVASDRRQTVLHRGRLADWLNGDEWQSAEQRLRQMQDGVQIIEARILGLPVGDERKALGIQKLAMQREITEFRKALHLVREARRGFGDTFVDIAKQILPKVQFEMIRNAAIRECDRRRKELEEADLPDAKDRLQP